MGPVTAEDATIAAYQLRMNITTLALRNDAAL